MTTSLHSVGLDPNFAEILAHRAATDADRPAVTQDEHAVTWAELAGRAGAARAALVDASILPGDRVAVLLERGAEAAAVIFGVLAAGGVMLNINESLRTRQIEYILRHADARALIASPRLLSMLPRPVNVPSVITILVDHLPPPQPLRITPRIGRDLAQIIYTSGSTGPPKGVSVAHANLWAATRTVVHYLGIEPDDRIASLLPFSFTYGLNQLCCAVGSGAQLVVVRSQVPESTATSLRAHRVTIAAGVPPLWLALLGAPAFHSKPLPDLRMMTNAGGRLPVDAVRRLRAVQPHTDLYLMYGLTEVIRSTYLPPGEVDRHPDSMGRAIPGADVLVVDDDGNACAPGEVGELVHRGPTVALGYWKDPEGTARVFRPHPLRPAGTPDTERVVFSGDLVRRDEEGYFYFVGRRDRMMKTLGHRVSPDEIEEVLYASGEVAEAIVLGEPDQRRGTRIVAYVALTPSGSLDRLTLFAKTELPRYMHPQRFEVRDALPRTATGKFNPQALAAET